MHISRMARYQSKAPTLSVLPLCRPDQLDFLAFLSLEVIRIIVTKVLEISPEAVCPSWSSILGLQKGAVCSMACQRIKAFR
mmetsp:Transcript_39251/g.76169  ORF Transcript_39251/g.76169 Transcript_39251/m.76169 type:complete len:81 (+) Transcript_39251:82-324(+)